MASPSRFAVARHIVEMILEANLPEGHVLPAERELAKQLFVGRGLLREALRILELQGLLAVKPGRGGGIRVRRPSVDAIARDMAILFRWEHHSLEEIMQLRRIIEVSCVREICRAAYPPRLRRLRRYAGSFDPPAGDGTMPYARFHHLLVAGANNRPLLQMYRAICQAIYLDVATSTPACAAEHQTCVREHHAIVDAIESGDVDLAEWRLSTHLVGSHLEAFLHVYREAAHLEPRTVAHSG